MNRHRSEAGFALLEVIVSAAVLAIIALAVLAGIDGAQSSTGREKARSIAANLAEQDQERMRSMQADTLTDYTYDRDLPPIDGSTYHVLSTATWVRDDSGGTVSCQNNSKQADYLKISSTVTSSTVGTRTKPVTIDSLVAPSVAYSSTRGSLAVQVNNRDGVGVPDLAVNIDGPASDSALTNANGCAVFQFIPVGNYNITLNTPGWVDHFGKTTSVGNQDVTAGKLNTRTMAYDRAAVARPVKVGTYTPGATNPNDVNQQLSSSAVKVSATNSDESGLQLIYTSAAPAATFEMTNLFPFKTAYAMFTGGCKEADPTTYDSDYFETYTGSMAFDAGTTKAVTVRQPPLNVRVRDRNGNPYNGATVRATLRTTGCTEDPFFMTTMRNSATGTDGWPSNGTAAFDPGLPFGKYDLCLEYKDGSTSSSYRHWSTTYDNVTALGQPATKTYPDSGSWSNKGSRYCT
jgi:type II secretory pathway pseudopilin PulG